MPIPNKTKWKLKMHKEVTILRHTGALIAFNAKTAYNVKITVRSQS